MALSIMNQEERADWEMCHKGGLLGSKKSSENLTKTQDLAYSSQNLKVMRAQQQKRLGPASCSNFVWHLSRVLS